jgi:hypothetical protein
MPAASQRTRKKRPKDRVISKEQALDFAQLVLDIFKDKKQA